MSGIISSRPHSRAESIGQPNLRLVTSDRSHQAIARPSEQSPKTAVMACLTARSSGNSELLRKASAAARGRDGEFYAVLVDSPRTRFSHARVGTLIDDAILASYLGANRMARILRRGRRAAAVRAAISYRPHLRCEKPARSVLSTIWAHGLFRSVEPRRGFSYRRYRV